MWVFPLIQGYVEVRQIPVLSEDTPKVLLADWSVLYQEERRKLLLEVMKEGKGTEEQREVARGRGGSDVSTGGPVEVEMQDMAAVTRKELTSKFVGTEWAGARLKGGGVELV